MGFFQLCRFGRENRASDLLATFINMAFWQSQLLAEGLQLLIKKKEESLSFRHVKPAFFFFFGLDFECFQSKFCQCLVSNGSWMGYLIIS